MYFIGRDICCCEQKMSEIRHTLQEERERVRFSTRGHRKNSQKRDRGREVGKNLMRNTERHQNDRMRDTDIKARETRTKMTVW